MGTGGETMAGWNRRSTAEEVTEGVDLRGRTAIVTGANAGLGTETARVLALRGAHVVMACRNEEKAEKARSTIVRESEGKLTDDSFEIQALDLASLDSVRSFASNFIAQDRPLHLLVNNAGIMIPDRLETVDGFEAHFGTNHLGHFLLTNLLIDLLKSSGPARVVNVSSEAMQMSGLTRELDDLNWEQRSFSGWRAYGNSKLMNLLFTRALARRYGDAGISSNALHPGMIRTELARSQRWPFLILGVAFLPWMKTVEAGAATTAYLATAPEFDRGGGGYFSDCAPARPPKLANDEDVQERLWEISARLTGLDS